jgi:hypothetical protein
VVADSGRADSAWQELVGHCARLAAAGSGADQLQLQEVLTSRGIGLQTVIDYRQDVARLAAATENALQSLEVSLTTIPAPGQPIVLQRSGHADGFVRASIPGDLTLHVDHAATYYVFAEGAHWLHPSVQVTDPEGHDVAVGATSPGPSYYHGGNQASAVGTFRAVQPGDYKVAVSTGATAPARSRRAPQRIRAGRVEAQVRTVAEFWNHGSCLAPGGRSGSTSNPGSGEETQSPYDLHDIWLA